jgi:branched-chain amino acid aminotransferase
MFQSAQIYNMKLPYSQEELTQAILDTIQANGFKECYIRPIAFYGSSTLGVHPLRCPVEVAILAWPWGAYLGPEALEQGIQVTVSRWHKFSSSSMPAVAKACGQYVNSSLAVQDAVARGFDEALLIDDNGIIAEGSGENLFLVQSGTIVTNDEKDNVLMGITRDAVITLARDLGYRVQIGQMRLEELEVADEAFFTGTAAEVTPISSIDRRPIGNGRRGPVTAKLQEAFFRVVSGHDPKYDHWLTYVGAKANAAG